MSPPGLKCTTMDFDNDYDQITYMTQLIIQVIATCDSKYVVRIHSWTYLEER